mgnify:CR=1 FL=1
MSLDIFHKKSFNATNITNSLLIRAERVHICPSKLTKNQIRTYSCQTFRESYIVSCASLSQHYIELFDQNNYKIQDYHLFLSQFFQYIISLYNHRDWSYARHF